MGHVSSFSLYAASVLGAVALMMMMPRPGGAALKRAGAVLGAATLGGLWLWMSRHLPDLGENATPFAYYYVFSAIAILGGVRVITHTRPVYSALWFVMVVMASAGMLLILAAEFIAFALLIIYGGAILVTYVFVIMLAVPAADAAEETGAGYDRVARGPIPAVAAGFLLLAMLLHMATFERPTMTQRLAASPETRLRLVADSDSIVELTTLPRRATTRVLERLDPADRDVFAAELEPASPVEPLTALLLELTEDVDEAEAAEAEQARAAILEAWTHAGEVAIEQQDEPRHRARRAVAAALLEDLQERFGALLEQPLSDEQRARIAAAIAHHRRIDNIERVGLDLFEGNPLGLELAGVILLVALIGAVVVARQRVSIEPHPRG